MSLENNLNQSHTLDQWVVWFKNEFAPSDLDADGIHAFMHHFADLGILEAGAGQDQWKLTDIGSDSTPFAVRDKVLDQLEKLSATPAGFAVGFFLGRRTEIPPAGKETAPSPPVDRDTQKNNEQAPNREKSSDLSNLQIVKKVGRQLKPFLELEKETVTRLQGTHTQQKEARVIFNFILRHTQTKAEPKKWEQLSRKRHK